jgi:hypothetical protein
MEDFRSVSRLPEETQEEYRLRQKALKDTLKYYKRGFTISFNDHLRWKEREELQKQMRKTSGKQKNS